MRMRKKKNGTKRLMDCAGFWIENPTEYKNNWQSLFAKQAPLFVEIGCGKGGFITEMGKLHPELNFIAIEQNIDVLVLASERVKNAGLTNVKLIYGNARELLDIFGEHECDGLYINFCDPWHKNRHFKRRLTYKDFLDMYKIILKKERFIYLKTDNQPLFEFSLNSFSDNGFKLYNITFDLHNSDYEENVMTEYEKLFSDDGKPIYRVEALCL